MRTDRSGNYIGDGSEHADYSTFDFSDYPQIHTDISLSETTESVYVTYTNKDNDKYITLRFSDHENNATKFGDQLNGYFATKEEVLYKLGLMNRVFIPNKRAWIEYTQIKYKDPKFKDYEVADKTLKEMYEMGVGADISMYKGKLAKNSNAVIISDTIAELIEQKRDSFGNPVNIGTYKYEPIEPQLQKGIQVEQEHKETLEKVASGEISVEEAIKETAVEHIKENPNYYDELEKIETKQYSNVDKPLVNYYLSTSEHAMEYGFNAEKPVYVQNLYIPEADRRKGKGTEILAEIDKFAKDNNADLIFGYVSDNADKENTLQFLNKRGFTIQPNGDFYKVVNVETKSTPIEKPITYINTKNFDCIEKGQYDFSKVDIMNRDKENDTIIYVNPKVINEKHFSDYPQFSLYDSNNLIGDRISRVKKFLLEELPDCSEKQVDNEMLKTMFTAPIVKFDDKGKLFIEDGRHRLLVAEQMGFKKFPIQVPKEQVGRFEDVEPKPEPRVQTSFRNVKDGDYVEVMMGGTSMGKGIVSKNYSKNYITLNNDDSQKYGYLYAYYVLEQPKPDNKKEKALARIRVRRRILELKNRQ